MTASLRTLLVGDDPRQQLRVSQTLLALVVYVVFAGVQHVEVLLGMIDERASWALTAWNMSGGLVFYALVRSGWSRRLARDRALTVPQSLWAMVGIAWSYGITGPARGAVMLIMLLVVLFSMFTLDARQSRLIVGAGIALLGGTMAWKAATDPANYDPRVEALHFGFAAIVLSACALLSIRIGRLRESLQRQKTELAAALQRIQALATQDPLTGLPNRRAAIERLTGELDQRRRPPPQVAVALIDLDHFKRVNDRLGHAAGDEVLRRFAETSRAVLREGDVLARWGGEEFLLILPGAEGQQALEVLGRMRERLAQAPLDDLEAGLVVRFSAGVAVCDDHRTLDRSIEAADRAMYAAKTGGRDRALRAEDCATLGA